MSVVNVALGNIFYALCFRREEVSAEAQRVLRPFPTKSSEKEGPKPMPSFPNMVAYIQEKVGLRASHRQHSCKIMLPF